MLFDVRDQPSTPARDVQAGSLVPIAGCVGGKIRWLAGVEATAKWGRDHESGGERGARRTARKVRGDGARSRERDAMDARKNRGRQKGKRARMSCGVEKRARRVVGDGRRAEARAMGRTWWSVLRLRSRSPSTVLNPGRWSLHEAEQRAAGSDPRRGRCNKEARASMRQGATGTKGGWRCRPVTHDAHRQRGRSTRVTTGLPAGQPRRDGDGSILSSRRSLSS